ncbi:MAG TPA: integrin alpha [Planctomycetota bacterium]
MLLRISTPLSATGLRVLACLVLGAAFSAPLAAQTLAFEFPGVLGDKMGSAVALLGDLDGDGRSEIALGAPWADVGAASTGLVEVRSGSNGALLFQLAGGQAERLGASLARAGDVDGDGIPDVLAAAARDNRFGFPSGWAGIWSGATGLPLHAFASSSDHDLFAAAVAGDGDANADGHADVIVGAPDNDVRGPGSGSVYVYSGVDGSLLHLLHGEQSWQRFGHSLAFVGDVDRDGCDDFAVGSPRYDVGSKRDAGRLQIFSGRTGAQLRVLQGGSGDVMLGWAVAGGRDADFDGVPDFVVGSSYNSPGKPESPGAVELYSGADGTLRFHLDHTGIADRFGSVLALGDVNCDGSADVIAGLPGAGNYGAGNGLGSGKVQIYSGVDFARLYAQTGESQVIFFGEAVAGGGDLDGDGFEDWLVGVPSLTPGGVVRAFLADPRPKLLAPALVAGQGTDLVVQGADPGAQVRFHFSRNGFGDAVFPSLGIRSDLASPVVFAGSASADGAGEARLPVGVPGSARGLRVWLQAAARRPNGLWQPSTPRVADVR